ncbi:hypothetical protein JCM9279_007106 [Rhodotorula babjevae]
MDPFRLPSAPTRATGTAPDHPSPTKRRKVAPPPPTPLDATLSTSSLLAFALPPTSHPEQQPPLAQVPAPLALLALAVSLRTSAQALLPALAKRPSSTSTTNQQRYAQAWAEYHRSATAAILALRAAVHLTASASDYAGGRLELRACAMLAEALVDLYDGSGSEHVVAPEADRVLSRAIAISQSHPSLAPYSPALSLLHLRLSLFSHKPLKFIRTTLRRLVQSLPPLSAAVCTSSAGASSSPAHFQPGSRPPPAASAATAAATYAAHALTASIPGATPLEALSAWDTVRELATDRGDDEVRVVAALAGARLALEAEDYARCGALLGELRGAFDPPEGGGEGAGEAQGEAQGEGAHGPPPPTRPRLLDVQYRLVACLYHFQVGDAKLAKETLKRAHALLDAVPAAAAGAGQGGEGGEVTVIVNAAPGSTDSAATIRFQVPSQATLYPFAFLASAAIHLDPQGKTPRAQLFGEEGVRITEQRLNGREVTLPVPSLRSISTSLTRAAALQSRLYLLLSSLSILRSEYPAAHAHLARALGVASAHAPASAHDNSAGAGAEWADEVQLRAALAWALLRCARAARDGADEREAERALEAVLDAASAASSSGAGAARTSASASPQMAHLVTIARLSLVLLRMSAPPGALASIPVTSTDSLVRALAASSASTSTSAASSSHARLAAALATALTARSITASKAALSQALSLTNQMGATHARAGVLALLGNVFLWTREGEAQRMLSSALRLASSFGSPAARTVDGVPVGHARLSLWLGQRLADTYRANPQSSPELVAAQERANAACRSMVAREALEAQQEDQQQTVGDGARDVEMREA